MFRISREVTVNCINWTATLVLDHPWGPSGWVEFWTVGRARLLVLDQAPSGPEFRIMPQERLVELFEQATER